MNLAFVGMAAALGLSASGSAFGAGFAGQAAVGAWKKCYASGKPAPFIMIAFAGAMRLKQDPGAAHYDYGFTVRPRWPLEELAVG